MTGNGGIVYTIGHSNHSAELFLSLLNRASIDAIADVRSNPYSRRNPQFNRETLQATLAARGVAYVWLGDGLGARPSDPALRRQDGGVDYKLVAASAAFRKGIERVCEGVKRHAVALMCAERAPVDCHRTILVARHLAALALDVRHVLEDGRVVDHREIENQIICRCFPNGTDLFLSARQDLLATAYDKLWQK